MRGIDPPRNSWLYRLGLFPKTTAVCHLVLVGAVTTSRTAVVAKDIRLFDFENPGLSSGWTAARDIIASRGIPPKPRPDEIDSSDNYAAHVETSGQSGFYSKPGRVPRNWENCDQITFWVFRMPGQARETVLEFHAYGPRDETRFWRKMSLAHTGWKRVSLPRRIGANIAIKRIHSRDRGW